MQAAGDCSYSEIRQSRDVIYVQQFQAYEILANTIQGMIGAAGSIDMQFCETGQLFCHDIQRFVGNPGTVAQVQNFYGRHVADVLYVDRADTTAVGELEHFQTLQMSHLKRFEPVEREVGIVGVIVFGLVDV